MNPVSHFRAWLQWRREEGGIYSAIEKPNLSAYARARLGSANPPKARINSDLLLPRQYNPNEAPYRPPQPAQPFWLAVTDEEGDIYVHVDHRRKDNHGPLTQQDLGDGVIIDTENGLLFGIEILAPRDSPSA